MPYRDPEARRRYQREWVAQRRKEWIDQHGPCAQCGSRQDMEIDHIDRTEKVSHRIWSWSKARREVELAKCQVLCGDCHRAKSKTEQRRVGEAHPNAMFTEEQIIEMRARASGGETQVSIARAFGVTKQYVWEVVHRKTWVHI